MTTYKSLFRLNKKSNILFSFIKEWDIFSIEINDESFFFLSCNVKIGLRQRLCQHFLKYNLLLYGKNGRVWVRVHENCMQFLMKNRTLSNVTCMRKIQIFGALLVTFVIFCTHIFPQERILKWNFKELFSETDTSFYGPVYE